MSDLQIPNLNNKSEKFIFKKKLSLRRKSKTKLIKESLIMFFFSAVLIYVNYLIPNKILVFTNLLENFSKLSANLIDSISHLYEISLVLFMIISIVI